MRSKKAVKFIIIGILLILTLFLLLFIYVYYSFKINGKRYIKISYDETYKDNEASFKLFFKDYSNLIERDTNYIEGKVGKYYITYSIKILFFTISKNKYILVYDKKKPIITLNGKKYTDICLDKNYIEQGYQAFDEYDKDITSKVKIKYKDDKIIYSVKDSSNNETIAYRKIVKIDKEAPIIKLNGEKDVTIIKNSKYTENGYTISDNCDSIDELKVKKENNININKEGDYYIKYIVTDSSGNTSTIVRNIHVRSNDYGVIYLTFDDGPSNIYTPKILDILKKYNIKATFFVTSLGNDELIKREYDEGHTVALHTYSHIYSKVYKNDQSYIDDLNKISNRVYKITGNKSFILRFPGGTSNTVSKYYNKGIMSRLSKKVIDMGYTYFDWNIDSGDTFQIKSKQSVYDNVTKSLKLNKANVVLMHDIKKETYQAIEEIIKYAKDHNYKFKKLDKYSPTIRFKPNN